MFGMFWLLFGGGGLAVIGLVALAVFVKPLRQIAITAAVVGAAALTAVGYGVSIEAAACNAAHLQQELDTAKTYIDLLHHRIHDLTQAVTADQGRAADAERQRQEAEDRSNELSRQIADGACFAPPDTDRVRQLWGIAPAKGGAGDPASTAPGRSKAVPKPNKSSGTPARNNVVKGDVRPDRKAQELVRREGPVSTPDDLLLRGRVDCSRPGGATAGVEPFVPCTKASESGP